MKNVLEFLKGALLVFAWPLIVLESWRAIPPSERDDFAGALNWIAVIMAALVWLTYYVDLPWLKVPLGLLTFCFYLVCGLFIALALVLVDTPEYDDY